MTTQMLWIALGIFILGLFVGSNLGVLLMCVLQVAAAGRDPNEELTLSSVQVDG